MKAVNIKWDIDSEDFVSLPTSMDIPKEITTEEEISDYLSNITGYCHKGYNLLVTAEEIKDFIQKYIHLKDYSLEGYILTDEDYRMIAAGIRAGNGDLWDVTEDYLTDLKDDLEELECA